MCLFIIVCIDTHKIHICSAVSYSDIYLYIHSESNAYTQSHLPSPTTYLKPCIFSPHPQAQAAGQGAADEPPAAQPAPADPPAQNEAEPEPPDVPPDQGVDPELEEEEGAAAEDADANNGAQGWNLIRSCHISTTLSEMVCSFLAGVAVVFIVSTEVRRVVWL